MLHDLLLMLYYIVLATCFQVGIYLCMLQYSMSNCRLYSYTTLHYYYYFVFANALSHCKIFVLHTIDKLYCIYSADITSYYYMMMKYLILYYTA